MIHHAMKRPLLLLLSMNIFSLLSPFLHASPLAPGAQAPVITATDQDGRAVSFPNVYARGITLVYFYPKVETPGCTAEACSLRDAYEGLQASGLQILGVSKDNSEAQKKFQTNRKLPFTLIADTDGRVAAAFGVATIPVLGLTMRQSFLVKDGKIAWSSLSAQTSGAAEEVRNALETLKER